MIDRLKEECGRLGTGAVISECGHCKSQVYQWRRAAHNIFLSSVDIVHQCIPSCTPQYNGSVECGVKEFKNVFYNVWERREREETDKEKSLKERVLPGVYETVRQLNEVIPRPALGGVTPADVHAGRKATRKAVIEAYYEMESGKTPVKPWKRKYWNVLTDGAKAAAMSTKELLTKMAFFVRRPLRGIRKLNKECVG